MIRRRVLTPRQGTGGRPDAGSGPSYPLGVPRLPAALLLVSALAVAACGSSDDDDVVASSRSVESTTTTSGDAPTPAETTTSPAADVPEELDFVAPDVRGGQVVGADFAGQAMVIWFWAPW